MERKGHKRIVGYQDDFFVNWWDFWAGAVKADILWWHMYLQYFNGVSAFIEPQPFAPVLTDACTAAGGAFLNGDFMYVRWDSDVPSVQDCPINYKEAMIAAISIRRGRLISKIKLLSFTQITFVPLLS